MRGLLRTTAAQYRDTVANPGMGRLLPALLCSSIGDGMSFISIPWLALTIAPPQHRGAAVAVTVAAYTLPGLLGGLLLDRLFHNVAPKLLVTIDASLRATTLLLIPVLYALDLLTLAGLVVIIAVSSLAHAWGMGGRLALVRRLVRGDMLPANALLAAFTSLAIVLGPALGGVLVAAFGAPFVVALDGGTFVLLAVVAATMRVPPAAIEEPAGKPGARTSGLRVLVRDGLIVKLLVLTFICTLFGGFMDVGLPLFVDEQLRGAATTFGLVWAGFGFGRLVGSLLATALRPFPLYETAIVIAFGWSLSLTAAIEPGTAVFAIVFFTIGGLVFGPYPALMTTLLTERLPRAHMAAALAAWSALLTAAAPLGTLLGGAIATFTSGLSTLRVSAYGVFATALVLGAVQIRDRMVAHSARSAHGARPRAGALLAAPADDDDRQGRA